MLSWSYSQFDAERTSDRPRARPVLTQKWPSPEDQQHRVRELSASIGRKLTGKMVKILRGGACRKQPTAFELVIDLRTAKTANPDLATGIVAHADKVIE
jgi:hypothetical protein